MLSKILPRTAPRAKNPLLLAYNNEKRAIQLKPYKRLHFQFDPFHPQVASIRQFLININTKQARSTNPKCTFRTDILSGGEEPIVTAHLENGKKIIFKTANLSLLELLQHFNQFSDRFTETQ
ncbi:39S ribosomal protein L53/MRP-L53 [Blomia tropicalis]|nr:39S ribosomal protein L53/MRP-L53 [Blomia tropicalis]